jgi:hypothetical protein
MVTRRLVHLSVILLLITLSCQFIQSLIPSGGNSAEASSVLLNEVRFLPVQGEVGFVELKSPGKRVSLEGLYLKNERGDSYSLPDGVNALSPDQFMLILFDGTNIVEDKTIHASQTGFLNPESGFIELYASDGTLQDRVAWGTDQPASVKLTRGGMIFDIEPGTTIGRFPQSVLLDPLEWTIFSPMQATPGVVNPQPGVEVMLPLNGAVIPQTSIELSWYPVPGPAKYHIQVAGDETMNAPLIDEPDVADSLMVELQEGTYYWRVQAISEDGEAADFSPVQKITVKPGFSSVTHLAAPRKQTTLGVPFIGQHKDTQMILLESPNETGEHAWDVAHPELDRSDPADNTNCALASIAMINAYLGGDLSQDRIGFEVFKDTLPGPEWDMNYGRGLVASQTTQALSFALDAEPVFRPEPEDIDGFWAEVQFEIDLGRPILAALKPGHAIVITGYYEDESTRYVMINDPWWGQYAVDIALVRWKYYWMISPDSIPILNDPGIGIDSDGDGIVDFDETNRFGTDPNDNDTDQDDLKDKDDLRASIFDEQWGYALSSLSYFGRDYDQDGIKMELDEDSDGGGCFDGMEDFDLDGKYKEPETWNFDEKDDACFWGTHEVVLDDTDVSDDGSSIHQRQRFFAKFSLRAVENGRLEGIAQVSYEHTGENIELSSDPCIGTSTLVGGETHYWQADLKGDFQKLGDGSTLVSFDATPDHGPAYTLQWVGPCPSDPLYDEGWPFPALGAPLKDGVYDLFTDLSSPDSGEFWQKIHVEQGQGME